jgi:hypothetical protein
VVGQIYCPWINSEQKVKDVAHKLIGQALQKLTKTVFTAEPVYKLGDPAEKIMSVASKRRADFIVGSQRSGYDRPDSPRERIDADAAVCGLSCVCGSITDLGM